MANRILIVTALCILLSICCAPEVRVLKYQELQNESVYFARPLCDKNSELEKAIGDILNVEMTKYTMDKPGIYKRMPYSLDTLISAAYQRTDVKNLVERISAVIPASGIDYVLLIHDISGKASKPTATEEPPLDFPVPILVPVPGVGLFVAGAVNKEELGKQNQFDYIECAATLFHPRDRRIVFSTTIHAGPDKLTVHGANKPIALMGDIFNSIYQQSHSK